MLRGGGGAPSSSRLNLSFEDAYSIFDFTFATSGDLRRGAESGSPFADAVFVKYIFKSKIQALLHWVVECDHELRGCSPTSIARDAPEAPRAGAAAAGRGLRLECQSAHQATKKIFVFSTPSFPV